MGVIRSLACARAIVIHIYSINMFEESQRRHWDGNMNDLKKYGT